MYAVMLVALLVHSDGYDIIGVQPFKTLTECQAERTRIVGLASSKMPQGSRYVVECNPVKTAGPTV